MYDHLDFQCTGGNLRAGLFNALSRAGSMIRMSAATEKIITLTAGVPRVQISMTHVREHKRYGTNPTNSVQPINLTRSSLLTASQFGFLQCTKWPEGKSKLQLRSLAN